jgi:uncharacterized membrane protein YkvI
MTQVAGYHRAIYIYFPKYGMWGSSVLILTGVFLGHLAFKVFNLSDVKPSTEMGVLKMREPQVVTMG